MNTTLAMVMAGGKGSRLGALTVHRAKPSVPFAGRYRIIDFVLSNFINSGYRQVYVLTQYMASSLITHLSRNWHLQGINEFVEVSPAQMRRGEHWYRGTADAIYQNLNLIYDSRAEHVAVFGGDHIYKFAVDQMDKEHRDSGADLTIAACPVPREEARGFGVIQVDERGRIIGFQEKVENPSAIPGRPDTCLASMGNYIFKRDVLIQALEEDAGRTDGRHDFGHDIIPRLLASGADLRAYDLGQNRVPGDPPEARPYWRDVGTVDSYFQACMEVRSPLPALNLYNRQWRIRTAQRDYPPARFVQHHGQGAVDLHDSLVSEGSIVVSARLHEALVGYDCFIHRGASVQGSVLFSGCDVGSGAMLQNALLDKNCSLAAGARVGLNPERDRRRFPFISEAGVIVLPKGTHVPAEGPIELARDIHELLTTDPGTGPVMKAFEGEIRVSERRRHSHGSAGPGYHR